MDARESITRFLQKGGKDSSKLVVELFPLVYDELRRLAKQMMLKLPPRQTLQPTALVHEAFVRLVAGDGVDWKSRHHFFRTAARAMRFILVEQARRKSTAKHGRKVSDQDPDHLAIETTTTPEELLAVHEALTELKEKNPRQVQIVELRFFAGLTEPETAEILQISRASVAREWRYARYWLLDKISGSRGEKEES